jgi:hypothetical protein
MSVSGKTKAASDALKYDDAEHDPVTSVLRNGDVPDFDDSMDADERVITALGYKQEFKREFSLWTTFCVSFAVLGLLPSFASTIYYGKYSGLGEILNRADSWTQVWDMQEPLGWFGAGL